MTWNPHTLAECLDSPTLAYLTALLSVGMLVWYLMIAGRWLESLKLASASGRAVWGWLIAIFVICAMAGYVSLTLSLLFPKVSVWWRIVFLALQNIACPFFWYHARVHRFHLQAKFSSMGERVEREIIPHLSTMTDAQLASTMRSLAVVYTDRQS